MTPNADHGFALDMARRTRDSIIATSDLPGEQLMRPQYLVAQVREQLAEDAIVTLDNGIHKLWFTRNLPIHTQRTHVVDSALGSMGPSLSAAIAGGLVHPDRQVLAVTGDGGFLMNVQELETAVRLGLDLVVMILNDSGLGMIRMKQRRDGYHQSNVDCGNPNFATLAEAFGARGHLISDPQSVGQTLREALDEGGVHVIDVPIDYGENTALINEMKTADAAAGG